jgi:hypothetical protein
MPISKGFLSRLCLIGLFVAVQHNSSSFAIFAAIRRASALAAFQDSFQSTRSLITHEPQANRTSMTFDENPLRRVNALSGKGSM